MDNGLTYKPYSDDAVMTSPSTTAHFRDPYVFINKKTNKLTMYLAEGDKIGVYSSENGKKFDYVGAISLNKYALNGKDLGLIECPNLKTMYDVSTGATKEVLFFGGNGYNYGQTSGSYYMVGHLSDEGVFIVEQQPKRVDDGSDFYASNYFQTANNTNIISIAWLGNWSYSAKKIIDANYEQSYKLGSLSLAHKLNLTQKDGQYILKSSLIKPYSCLTNKTSQYVEASKQTRKTDGYYQLLNTRRWTSQNFYLQMTNQNQGKVNGHIKLSFKQKDSTVLFDYNADTGYYNVQRQTTNIADEEGNSEYSRIFTENSGVINPETFKLHVYVDKASIELEFENSERTYSLLKYTTDDDLSFKVETNSENNLFYTMSNIENSH